MSVDGRSGSLAGRLTRAGVADVARAERLLADAALLEVVPDAPALLAGALGDLADPDQALLTLAKLAGAVRERPELAALLRDVLTDDGPARARLLGVAGTSVALGDTLVAHPENLHVLVDDAPALGVPVGDVRAELLRAVGADPDAAVPVARAGSAETTDDVRRAYRTRLLRIAAADVTTGDPLSRLPGVAAALADLAAAALEAALAVARADLDDHGAGVRLAVIGMGKTGGRELNYVSDVDVVYVAEPVEGVDEADALAVGARLAAGLARVCSVASAEPALWPVDAALRPEGKDGPLVRTLASHRTYYERWAKTWEFQALLKARPLAGDPELGRAYADMTQPFVWAAVQRENFVEDAQAMRRRVEQHVPAAEADRQLKLGIGGLRDVEFTVQLLQLVHGRADDTIRSPSTLTALAALAAGGYVGREHAARLAVCYRWLRLLEHRIQMHRLRRTHLLPTAEADLQRLARSVGLRAEGAQGLLERWRSVRRDVRHLHEELFYRPLLPATAQLSTEEASLAPDAARARLAAIGYRDPAGALRHLAALTEGVSRRASIQRQLLPVMIGWFADGADPDGGLLAFRRLSDELGTTHWYLKLLRDSGTVAQRLAHVLSTSRYVADALSRSPGSVTWLAEDAELEPRTAERLSAEADAVLTRAHEPVPAVLALRGLRRRELARTAAADVLGVVTGVRAARSLTASADVVLAGTLRVAEWEARVAHGVDENPTRMLVVAMGRLGGREMGYSSDADVLFVHDPVDGADPVLAQDFALSVATQVRALLGSVGPEPALAVDADLRPEGRNGPLVRSFDAYAEYYGRWSSPWESQALLRARPVAGDAGLGERFVELVAPLRYPAGGLDAATVREVRRIKARVESERLPRGVDPARHLKLGRGGIADVEWTAQLLQLQHAHEVEGLRTTSTLDALAAAHDAGLLSADDARVLVEAWELASRLRDANVLWTGRAEGAHADVLPHDRQALAGVARVAGYPAGAGNVLEEDYLRTARRARAVVERVFYG
ncbi:bifunctional [glutamine synthetase] adenylyltransferase/[glutamine synthetase]-adenylyl-L-tyrosine phosphorylase [Cellulomonas fimi]|uniref:Bifunctional glutamine synthetase adenylyltransferase/adenylyl-removing enzyme n=1 Tax=Cellulomonas fimi (strain ATCC 484 / DSM 20113 / JCM 1341 / CCUG 24087 / LMG 16345 / NBRC 15513 / NCIMB 8980 / NCTC 7547 / NRS-133) TaxID=590998 RepID=F4H268_CELFA|nr:bifunctional [glutamine synthetase] adenylyltransferase/[glutamine synthetase]-adenylyl-L-tyrosine phosphorylase [Cellulomonas fimi]AEE46365.1 (Glutamate--ammonia-ligase) adenylyltransferase [Cellulomonas fimi ATCC 484]NNH07165.1 bifunctional [glutamine synthetase] adenylyltransferase/[glutamine synthetase]-adenylyl-L-tyrosine phosphorylase [Cellulomonas fimi]VEH32700.1 Glutamate-ammonia-ligase adenylyltransferase [Cellulomonas fimi]